MKYLLVGIIHLYWWVIPNRWKRQCLFKTTCSRHVHEVTKRSGLLAGLSALKQRIATCRSEHEWKYANGAWELLLKDGTALQQSEIHPDLLSEVCGSLSAVSLDSK